MTPHRKKIYDKFCGHCAYCGIELNGKFQIDHLIPRYGCRPTVMGVDDFENLMPACAKCNNHKADMALEWWRSQIEDQANIALQSSTSMQRALRWGLIQMAPRKIKFYFETIGVPS
jgi:hypothetical protein